jgi:hypothetical protein
MIKVIDYYIAKKMFISQIEIVPPPAGATYPGFPDLFRAATRAAGDTFLATGVSKIRLETEDGSPREQFAQEHLSPRRGRYIIHLLFSET